MTASSVEFFPCRVQLLGLPRSVATTNSVDRSAFNPNVIASVQTAPTRPPPLCKVQKVSRNLFGTPDPNEINNIYQQEARRQRSYVLQRYSFDIKTSKPTDKQLPQENSTTDSAVNNIANPTSPPPPTQLPTLIEQELEQHEKRLQKEERNINRVYMEKTPPNNKDLAATPYGSNYVRGCSLEETSPSSSTSSAASSSERHKPYARQSLLTESYNIRKNKICLTSSNAEMKSSIKMHHHRKLQVLQLPQAMLPPVAKEELSTSLCSLKKEDDEETSSSATTTSTSNDNEKFIVDDDAGINSSSNSCSNCTTTFSLNVVVTSQNASSAAAANSSESNPAHA